MLEKIRSRQAKLGQVSIFMGRLCHVMTG